MAENAATAPVLGAQGETCARCGAPLVPDQRYCLACGDRRAGPRLPFREILAHRPAAPPAPVAYAPPAVDRARANLALIAGLGCLLLALGVGILIGRSGHETVRSQAPQIISVGAGAPATTAAQSAPDGTDDAGAPAKGESKGKPKAEGRKPGVGPATSGTAPEASGKAIEDLQDASPQEYQKKSQKLPKTLSTGGEPPPVDKSKPAGGGTGFEDIG